MHKDIFTIANGVTVFRLVLFAIFVWYLLERQLGIAVGFFVGAWVLDGVDGWIARKFNQTTEFGSQLDKIIDRIIIFFGVLFLIKAAYLPRAAILLLAKDIALMPISTVHTTPDKGFKGAGMFGKLMTFLQGAGVLWLLFGLPYPFVVIGVVAALGAMVGGWHLYNVTYTQ